MITNRKMGDKVLVFAVSCDEIRSNDTIGCCRDPALISFGTAPLLWLGTWSRAGKTSTICIVQIGDFVRDLKFGPL